MHIEAAAIQQCQKSPLAFKKSNILNEKLKKVTAHWPLFYYILSNLSY